MGSTNEAYAEAYLGADAAIAVDAMTITPYLGLAAMQPILDRAIANAAGVFVVTRSSNPEGRAIQGARHPGATTVEHQLVIDIAGRERSGGPRTRSGPSGPCSARRTAPPPSSI